MRIQVYVAHPEQIGKFTRFTIRRTKPPSPQRQLPAPERHDHDLRVS